MAKQLRIDDNANGDGAQVHQFLENKKQHHTYAHLHTK